MKTKRLGVRKRAAIFGIFFLLLFLPQFNTIRAAEGGTFEITNLKLCTGVDENRKPIQITSKFPAGIQTVYGWFSWKEADPNLKMTARWFYETENIHILDFSITLTRRSNEGAVSLQMPGGKNLPDGSYRLDLEVNGKVVKSAAFTVLPAPSS